jgi:small-conductance mechanosensitive channel
LDLLDTVYYGNPVKAYLVATGIVLAILLAVRLIQAVVVRRLRPIAARTKSPLDDMLLESAQRTNLFLLLLFALYMGSQVLARPLRIQQLSDLVVVIVVLLQIGIWVNTAIKTAMREYRKRKEEEGDFSGVGTVAFLAFFGRMVVWAVILLLALDNLGVDVTALIAGLGIGGIAVALAMQNILGDIFASVSIMLDKPFEVGDFIIVDDCLGSVEKIGIKTTRVRSLSGEQLVFANSDLLQSRIRNYKRMWQRRATFSVGVTYQTPPDLVEEIPNILREAVESQERTRFDRAHFKSFGDSALIFETVFFVTVPEMQALLDIQQAINLHIMRAFEKRDISIAYPTQTLYVNKAA